MEEILGSDSSMELRHIQVPETLGNLSPESQHEIVSSLPEVQPIQGASTPPPVGEEIPQGRNGLPGELLARIYSGRNGRAPVTVIIDYLQEQDQTTPVGFWNAGAAVYLWFNDFLAGKKPEERDSILRKRLGTEFTTAKEAQQVFCEYRGDLDQYLRHGIDEAKVLYGRNYTWRTREDLHQLLVGGASQKRPTSRS